MPYILKQSLIGFRRGLNPGPFDLKSPTMMAVRSVKNIEGLDVKVI